MSARPDAILFQAETRGGGSLSGRGFRTTALLLGGAACLPAILFTTMGAWPVLGFLGLELPLVLGLLALQRQRAARVREVVVLSARGLTLVATDRRGRCETLRLDPRATRVEVGERGQVVLVQRDCRVELAGHLGPAARAEFAAALRMALARHRTRPEGGPGGA